MATRKTKNGDEERIDDASIEKVIKLLEPEEGKPITKKLACELLNIAYNTTRLGQLIDKYKEKKERTAKRRAEKRGKPVTLEEVGLIVSEYLEGQPISAISELLYRSTDVINRVLDEYSVPRRSSAYNYFRPALVPEGAMRDKFAVGEKVYSVRYDSLAIVDKELVSNNRLAYRLWLLADKWQQYCMQPPEELASLEHLTKLGIKI